MNRIPDVERRNSQLARLRHQHSEMCRVQYSLIILKMSKSQQQLLLNSVARVFERPKAVLIGQDNASDNKSIKMNGKWHGFQ